MPLSVDELLKPRIKRINKWPGMPHNCPELLKISGDRFYFPFDLDMELGYPLSSLPEWSHLVKPLEWWEDRKISDMPGYLKRPYDQKPFNNEVNKVEKYQESGSGLIAYHNSGYQHVSWFIPATESEYLSYTNSLTTKQD